MICAKCFSILSLIISSMSWVIFLAGRKPLLMKITAIKTLVYFYSDLLLKANKHEGEKRSLSDLAYFISFAFVPGWGLMITLPFSVDNSNIIYLTPLACLFIIPCWRNIRALLLLRYNYAQLDDEDGGTNVDPPIFNGPNGPWPTRLGRPPSDGKRASKRRTCPRQSNRKVGVR